MGNLCSFASDYEAQAEESTTGAQFKTLKSSITGVHVSEGLVCGCL